MRFVRPLVNTFSHYTEIFVNVRLDGKEFSEVSATESCAEMKSFESRRKEL
jgi:hypothetical protein